MDADRIAVDAAEGLVGWTSPALRPASRKTSWLAASEMASPIASGAIPSASAAAAASAACSAVASKIVLLMLDPGVFGWTCSQRLADKVILVEQTRARGRGARRSRACASSRVRS